MLNISLINKNINLHRERGETLGGSGYIAPAPLTVQPCRQNLGMKYIAHLREENFILVCHTIKRLHRYT